MPLVLPNFKRFRNHQGNGDTMFPGIFPPLMPQKMKIMMELQQKMMEFSNKLALMSLQIVMIDDKIDLDIDLKDVEELKDIWDEIRFLLEKLEKEVQKEMGVEP